MQKYGIDGGACLEIGSGTGNLTAGLVQQSTFTEVHCSDISAKFLNRLRAVLSDDKKLRYWLFDASALPFKSDSMDAIFGHSVLHHLLDYEGALKDVFRVLRPGGLAMFGEPIMDSHALTSFCAAIILHLENQNPVGGFSKEELNALRAMRVGSAVNGVRMRERRQELANMEDKHVYVIDDMYKLTREIGFREFEYRNAATIEKIGRDHKWRMMNILKRYGGTAEKLEPYDFIFSELSETYGVAMGSAAPFNFGYFILQK
jgi:ubiquinone/menaquinone biosynthesis C-methylase UbiE